MEPLCQNESNGSVENDDICKEIVSDSAKVELKKPHRLKDNELSVELRIRGNILFSNGKWVEAMELYNQSLCFAEIGSENVSLAFANRSSCFVRMKMYSRCLTDIDLSIKANYPAHLLPKLEERRADCLKKLEKMVPAEIEVPTLDYAEDKTFSGMANILKIQHNDKFGRHIVTTRDIEVGKTVLVEEAFVATSVIPKQYLVCTTCLKSVTNLIACGECANTMFCSDVCMNNNAFHKVVCGHYSFDNAIEHVARSIWHAINSFDNVDELMNFVETIVVNHKVPRSYSEMQSKYRTFLKMNVWFATPEAEKANTQQAIRAYNYLVKLPLIKEKFAAENHQRFLMHLCVQHYSIGKCNAFGDSLRGGSYLANSFFNHSCAPNVLRYVIENKLVCITSRPIKKGDQLFVSYGYWFETHQQRQINLNREFGFLCDCDNCEYCDANNCEQPISLTRIKLDPDYKYVERVINEKQYDYNNIAKWNIVKNKCLNVLTKYGNKAWNAELYFISYHLQSILGNINHYSSTIQ